MRGRRLAELVEAAAAEEEIADDEQRPAVADEIERARDGAILGVGCVLAISFLHFCDVHEGLTH